MTDRLALAGIVKRYPGVVANDDVSLRVAPGEIHAVLGENGAGKSTLMKIVYGSVRPDAGEIRIDGKPVAVRNPQEARRLGVSMVFQHFSLFETVTVAENVWLGLDASLSLAEVTARIRAKAGEYGLELDPARPVHTLSVGERQRVEIVRALLTDPRLLILDEPTSVLTPQAVERLFVTLRRLASTGCSILYISHKLDEIRALCSACTVMRGGRVTGVVDPRGETNASLSRLMIGAEPPRLKHLPREPGPVVLAVDGLSLPVQDRFGVELQDVRLEVRAGEMLYLPAGWFHLVESRGADLRNPRHMALNYWVHPPDAGSGRFDAPYTSEFWPRDWAARDVSALRIDRGSSSRKRKKGRVTPVHVEALDTI